MPYDTFYIAKCLMKCFTNCFAKKVSQNPHFGQRKAAFHKKALREN